MKYYHPRCGFILRDYYMYIVVLRGEGEHFLKNIF